MAYTLETVYNRAACTAMARALRKTVRKKQSRRTHIFGAAAAAAGVLLALPWYQGYVFGLRTAVTLIAVAVILLAMLLEDRLNGSSAARHMVKGTEKNRCVFSEDGFTTENAVGKTQWQYSSVSRVVRTGDYLVLLFDRHHAQAYDLRRVADPEGLTQFAAAKTGRPVERV